MATVAESSSATSKNDKPVIVRVKRKAFQSRLDAFWLEISERPLKRPLLDFGKLSISDSSSSGVEELKSKKILVRHVETVVRSENTIDVLRSFVADTSKTLEFQEKHEEKRRIIRTLNKQDELLVKAKQMQEVLSSNARYEQIWRSRKGKKDALEDETLHEMCRLYDVVKVDVDEQAIKVKQKDTVLEDHLMMSQYLPLLRDVLPTAAVEIEDDIHDYMSKQASSDDFVYDFYAVKYDADVIEADSASQYPLVQVDDDDESYYDGPDDSEYESDDSNAENNPLNDYPEEEISEEDQDRSKSSDEESEDEVRSRSSDEESEDENRTSGNLSQDLDGGSRVSEYDDSGSHDWSDDDQLFEYQVSEGNFEIYDDDSGVDEWR